jgi:hypothetical protein
MRRHAHAVREQSVLVSKSVEVVAWAALTNTEAHPTAEKPYENLRKLVRQLEQVDATHAGTE